MRLLAYVIDVASPASHPGHTPASIVVVVAVVVVVEKKSRRRVSSCRLPLHGSTLSACTRRPNEI